MRRLVFTFFGMIIPVMNWEEFIRAGLTGLGLPFVAFTRAETENYESGNEGKDFHRGD